MSGGKKGDLVISEDSRHAYILLNENKRYQGQFWYFQLETLSLCFHRNTRECVRFYYDE